jgi:hypothetical protein
LLLFWPLSTGQPSFLPPPSYFRFDINEFRGSSSGLFGRIYHSPSEPGLVQVEDFASERLSAAVSRMIATAAFRIRNMFYCFFE